MTPARRSRRGTAALAVVAVSTLLVAGCGGDDDGPSAAPASGGSPSSSPQGEPEPRRGGSLTYVHNVEPARLDPAGFTAGLISSDGAFAYAVFDALAYETADGSIVMRVAESIESNDALTWTLRLRPGVRFTDGTPYDAEAVRFNWQRIADPANRSPNLSVAQSIQSMEVTDPRTLRIVLKEPNGQFPRLVAKRIPFVGSPTALRAKGDQFGNDPVGAGPFMVRQWVRDSELRLVRNPDYWDPPRPYLDELVLRRLSDIDQRYNTFDSRQAQAAISVGSTPLLADRARRAGHPIVDQPVAVGGTLVFTFNTTKPPFDDVRARRALALGLDLARYNEVVNQGTGVVPDRIIREQSLVHSSSPTLAIPTFDPAEAQRLFDALAAEKGAPLEFTFLVSDNVRTAGEFFQAQLRQFRNVTMNVEMQSASSFLPRLIAKQFDFSMHGLPAADPEPDFFDHYHSTGTRNYMGYSNPEMDEALERGRRTLDVEERRRVYETVQRLILRDVLDIWALSTPNSFMLQREVQGFDASTVSPLWERLWLSD